jgi:hypothetical protein
MFFRRRVGFTFDDLIVKRDADLIAAAKKLRGFNAAARRKAQAGATNEELMAQGLISPDPPDRGPGSLKNSPAQPK